MSKNIYPIYTQVKKNPQTICAELTENVFSHPFFNQGVDLCLTDRSKKINLEKLDPIKEEDSLVLKGFIYHTSHCGSTLLSNMLGELGEVRIISETEAINGLLLSAILYNLDPDIVIKQLKKIVQLYCKKSGSQTSVILKLSSWNVFLIELFQKAFPNTKCLFLDRETDDLLSSLETHKGGFIDWWEHPVDVLRKYFLPPKAEIHSKRDFLLEMISGHREKAKKAKNEDALFLMYPDFTDKFRDILEHFKITPSEGEIERATQMLAYNSKTLQKIH